MGATNAQCCAPQRPADVQRGTQRGASVADRSPCGRRTGSAATVSDDRLHIQGPGGLQKRRSIEFPAWILGIFLAGWNSLEAERSQSGDPGKRHVHVLL